MFIPCGHCLLQALLLHCSLDRPADAVAEVDSTILNLHFSSYRDTLLVIVHLHQGFTFLRLPIPFWDFPPTCYTHTVIPVIIYWRHAFSSFMPPHLLTPGSLALHNSLLIVSNFLVIKCPEMNSVHFILVSCQPKSRVSSSVGVKPEQSARDEFWCSVPQDKMQGGCEHCVAWIRSGRILFTCFYPVRSFLKVKAGHTGHWWTSESVFRIFLLCCCTKGIFHLVLSAPQGQCHKTLTAVFVLSNCKCIIGFLFSFFQHYCSPYFSLQWMPFLPWWISAPFSKSCISLILCPYF